MTLFSLIKSFTDCKNNRIKHILEIFYRNFITNHIIFLYFKIICDSKLILKYIIFNMIKTIFYFNIKINKNNRTCS